MQLYLIQTLVEALSCEFSGTPFYLRARSGTHKMDVQNQIVHLIQTKLDRGLSIFILNVPIRYFALAFL